MKEHLYKAKRADGNGWIVGYYIKTPNGEDKIIEDIIGMEVLIQADTVCEYTGLIQSKDNQPIWENDILRRGTGRDTCDGIVRFGKYSNPWNSGGTHVGFYIDWQDDFEKNVLRKDLPFWVDRTEYAGNLYDTERIAEGSKEKIK